MKMMSKICFILPQFKTGGGNRVFVELANILVDERDIEIIYPKNSLEKNSFSLKKEVKIISIGKFYKNKFLKIKNLFELIFWINKNRKEEIIVISDPIMSILSFLFLSKKLIRFIQADDYRIYDLNKEIIGNKFLLFLYKKLIKFSYMNKNIKFIFNSKFVYDQFVSISSLSSRRNIVHPGVNLDIFCNIADKKKPEDKRVNLCLVARKHPLKGLDKFLQVWDKLECKDKIKNVNIICFEEIEELKKYKKIFNIKNPNSDKEISELMNKSDIFISTSVWEGFGLPSLEAMACGCSIISTKNGGCNEYLIENENAFLFEESDLEDFKVKLTQLIEEKELREKFSNEGLKTVKKFSWENTAKQFKNILKEELK